MNTPAGRNPGNFVNDGNIEPYGDNANDPISFDNLDFGKDVSTVFRIGDVGRTRDVVYEGHRYFFWKQGEHDDELADLAGWAILKRDNDYGFVSTIEVPPHTRTAASVLSGLSAWDSEKSDVLKFIARYQRQVRGKLGRFDKSVSLDSVGITKFDRQFLVVPPHFISKTEDEDTDWLHRIIGDIEEVLATNQEERRDLIKGFLEELTTEGGEDEDTSR